MSGDRNNGSDDSGHRGLSLVAGTGSLSGWNLNYHQISALIEKAPNIAFKFQHRGTHPANDNGWWTIHNDVDIATLVFAPPVAPLDFAAAFALDGQREAQNGNEKLRWAEGDGGSHAAASPDRLRDVKPSDGFSFSWMSHLAIAGLIGSNVSLAFDGETGLMSATFPGSWLVSTVSFAPVSSFSGSAHSSADASQAATHTSGEIDYASVDLAASSEDLVPDSDDALIFEEFQPASSGSSAYNGTHTATGLVSDEFAGKHDASEGKPVDTAQSDTANSVGSNEAGSSLLKEFGVAGDATDTVQQFAVQTVVLANNKIATLHLEKGDAPGESILKVTLQSPDDEDSAPDVVTVTENAVTEDASKPQLDLKPTLTAVDDQVAVAWVEKTPDNGLALKLQIYDEDAKPVADAPIDVQVTSGPDSTVSDFDLAAISTSDDNEDSHEDHGHCQEATVAVVWVQDADENGYGQIMGQRYGVVSSDDEDDSETVVVPLGRDGSVDGIGPEGDGPYAITADAESDVGVVGRAPQIAGCGEDRVAVVWVEPPVAGGYEQIAGAIYDADTSKPVLTIDLAGLLPFGIAAGTEPSLLTDDRGDIVVSWMQQALNGLFEAAAAVYQENGPGHWIPPQAALILQTFASLPDQWAVTLSSSGSGDVSLKLVWSDEDLNSISVASFDLDGIQNSATAQIDVGHLANDGPGSLSVAGFDNGNLVVVFTDVDASGDMDVSGLLIGDSSSCNSGSGDDSSDLSSNSGPSRNSGPSSGDQHDVSGSQLVLIDLESDLIQVVAQIGNGNSGSGKGSSQNDSGGSDNSGKNPDATFDNDNIPIADGYGNDTDDYYFEDHQFDDQHVNVFDALQFANALVQNDNGEVLIFDASNIVQIKDFDAL